MKISAKKIMLIAFSFSAGLLFAENNESAEVTDQSVTINIDQAVSHALKYSNSLKVSELDLEIQKRASSNAWNVFLPSLKLAATMARSSNDTVDSAIESANKTIEMTKTISKLAGKDVPIPAAEATESAHWAGVTSLTFGWNFSVAFIEQIKSAKLSYQAGKISYEKSMRDTEVSVRKLFYALLLLQEKLNLQKTALENARQRYIQADTSYRNGSVPEIRVLQAQVAYENQKPEVSKAEYEFKSQLDTFAFLLGFPVGTNIKLEGSINPKFIDVDYDSFMKQYSKNSFDYRSLETNIQVMEANLKAINFGTYIPALAVSYSFQPTLTNFLSADKGGWPKGDWKDNGSLSLTVAWDLVALLPWSSQNQKAKDLKTTLEKLKINRDMLVENQKIVVRNAVDTLNDARSHIASMERNINLAQRSYEMTYRSWRNGTTELLDLRDAEDQLNQAKLGLTSQKFNYISALLDLETVLNANLTFEESSTDNAK